MQPLSSDQVGAFESRYFWEKQRYFRQGRPHNIRRGICSIALVLLSLLLTFRSGISLVTLDALVSLKASSATQAISQNTHMTGHTAKLAALKLGSSRHQPQEILRAPRGASVAPDKDAELPLDTTTLTLAALVLLAACVAVSDEVISRDVTFEQGALAVAMPAASAWRAKEDTPWAAPAIRICALIGILGFTVERVLGVPIVDVKNVLGFAPFLAVASLLGLAVQTYISKDETGQWTFAGKVPLPPPPISAKIPYWQFAVIILALLSQYPDARAAIGMDLVLSQDIENAMGLFVGRVSGYSLIFASVCAVVTPLALVWWSRSYAKGQHGAVQEQLAPILLPSPFLVIPFAVINALAEEVEFRMMLQGSLLAGPAAGSYAWVALAVTLQAVYFAVLHYRVGLPSGRLGFVMVFAWALFLGFLRWWGGGVGLVLMLHIQADIVIFLLVLIEEAKRAEAVAQRRLQPSDSLGQFFKW